MEDRTIRKVKKCVENVDEILKGGPGSGRKGHTTQRKESYGESRKGDVRAKNKKRVANPYSDEHDPSPDEIERKKKEKKEKGKKPSGREKTRSSEYSPMHR